MISTHRARSVVSFLQRPGAFLLKELRGGQVRYFLEPGSIQVRTRFAEEALTTGFLAPRDFDLLNQPMSWVYARKPATPIPNPPSTQRRRVNNAA